MSEYSEYKIWCRQNPYNKRLDYFSDPEDGIAEYVFNAGIESAEPMALRRLKIANALIAELEEQIKDLELELNNAEMDAIHGESI